ncbi:hypothetical protein SAMN05444392_11348 [Seinonella peptonophila]|uniref:O-antigen ligase n=1 Tax=Seinonella peptonophila TaxID=112248 RepID=A0A1M5ADH6_9BACL|nr:hypothetical protein [Seinonella peptonophila]SHF28340.1 hypothetical protein SAMN05444392_11348 [Seinonella peptonophila]
MLFSGIVITEPAIFDILIITLLITGALLSYLKFRRYLIRTLTFVLMYLAGILLSMYQIINLNEGIYYLTISVYLICLWIFFIGVLTKFRRYQLLEKIFFGYTIAAFFSSILSIFAFFQLIPHYNWFIKYDRATALFQDPNVFGAFLIPISIYAIHKITRSSKKKKIIWFTIFLSTSMGVLLSFSRAAWLNYFVSLSVFIFLRTLYVKNYTLYLRPSFLNKKILLILMALLSISFLCLFNINSFHELFTQRSGLQWYDQQRFATQSTIIQHTIVTPLGIGPGQAEMIYGLSPHNLYIRVLIENGWLGFVGFMLLFMSTINRSIRRSLLSQRVNQPYFALFASVLIGIFVNSFFIDSLHWRHFWLFLALPWAPLKKKRQ